MRKRIWTMAAATTLIAWVSSACVFDTTVGEEPATHLVTVSLSGSGTGVVTSDHGGIDCPGACSAELEAETEVVLTATPAADSLFVAWSGDPECSAGQGPQVTLRVTRALECTAELTRSHELTVTLAGDGRGSVASTPAGIACGNDCAARFAEGASIELAAVPEAGSFFAGWDGDCSGRSSPALVTMSTDRACAARFMRDQRYISVSLAGEGSGTVVSVPPGIQCPADCAALFYLGESVTLAASPDAESYFIGWGGDCAGAEAETTIDASDHRACTATFGLRTLTVTLRGLGTGTVSSEPAAIVCPEDCDESFSAPTHITLTAAAGPWSYFAGWSGGCTGAGATTDLTVDAALTCTATFELTEHEVTVSLAGDDAGAVRSSPSGIDCPGTCTDAFTEHQAEIMLEARPAEGACARFLGWGGDCAGEPRLAYVSVDGPKSCTAEFAPLDAASLTVEVVGGGVVSLDSETTCDGTCVWSVCDEVQLTARAEPGMRFDDWGGDCTGAAVTSLVLNGDAACTATFVPSDVSAAWLADCGGSGGLSLVAGTDGGYAITGTAGNGDLLIADVDASGAVRWQAGYAWSGGFDGARGSSIIRSPEGHYVVAGLAIGYANARDGILILDIDAQTGAVNWVKSYGSSSWRLGRALAVSLREVAAGGYVIAANTPSFGAGGEELWLLRLDSAGGVLWSRTYGGAEDVAAEDLRVTADGGYIVAGQSGGDGWLLKLDASGAVQWQKRYRSPYWRVTAHAVRQTADAGFVMGGHGPGFDAHGAFVAKVDQDGDLTWQRSYQLGFHQYYRIIDLVELAHGGYVAAAGFDNWDNDFLTGWMMELSSEGRVAWSRTYAPMGNFGEVMAAADGGYVVVGLRSPDWVAAVLKTDETGFVSATCPDTLGASAPVIERPTVLVAGDTDVAPRETAGLLVEEPALLATPGGDAALQCSR